MDGFNVKEFATNTLVAFFSQGVALVASCLTSLIVPKFISITDFGYWQLFIFYSSYVGFFALGAIDGVYLINGGKPRNEINKANIASQFWFSTAYVGIFSLVTALGLCWLTPKPERQIVLILTAIYSIFSQMSAGLGYILQAMNETKTYSKSVVIDRFSFVIFLLLLLVSRCTNFVPYVVFYICSKLICFVYCAIALKDFFGEKLLSLDLAAKETFTSIKVGINLMFANVASMLVTGITRMAIDNVWGIEVFSKISFSLSLVSFFSTFVSQASMVLFPALRQGTIETQTLFYKEIQRLLELATPFIYLCYFPAAWILNIWLPQYSDSIAYFAFLLPICAYDAKMNICGTTYYKVLRLEKKLLVINLLTVATSAFLTVISVFMLNSLYAALFSMVISIALRSLVSELYLNRFMKLPNSPLIIPELFFSVLFICLNIFLDSHYALIIYFICTTIFAFINKSNLATTALKLKSAFSK